MITPLITKNNNKQRFVLNRLSNDDIDNLTFHKNDFLYPFSI